MEFRNIKRWFLMGKALRKYNKKSPVEITQKRLTLMLMVYHMNQHSIKCTQSNIHRYLKLWGRSDDWLNVHKQISFLVDSNILHKEGTLYRLTIEGRLILQQIEEVIRKERFDR